MLGVPCVTLPKSKEAGAADIEVVPTPPEPVPESPIEAVAFPPLPPTIMVAFLTPAELGVKTTITVQLVPTGRDWLGVQVPPVRANCGSLKVATMVPNVAVAVPLLVTVAVCGELEAGMVTVPKGMLFGEMVRLGAGGWLPGFKAPIVQGPLAGRGLPFLSLFNS